MVNVETNSRSIQIGSLDTSQGPSGMPKKFTVLQGVGGLHSLEVRKKIGAEKTTKAIMSHLEETVLTQQIIKCECKIELPHRKKSSCNKSTSGIHS